MDAEFPGDDFGASGSDVEEFDYSNNKYIGRPSSECRGFLGTDLVFLERNTDKQYKNYENAPSSGESSENVCKNTQKGGPFYHFWRNSRSIKSTILHLQLRYLVWATSKHDVYLMSNFRVTHYASLTSGKHEVLNFQGHVAPSETRVSTLAVKDDFLVAGGFLICKWCTSFDCLE